MVHSSKYARVGFVAFLACLSVLVSSRPATAEEIVLAAPEPSSQPPRPLTQGTTDVDSGIVLVGESSATSKQARSAEFSSLSVSARKTEAPLQSNVPAEEQSAFVWKDRPADPSVPEKQSVQTTAYGLTVVPAIRSGDTVPPILPLQPHATLTPLSPVTQVPPEPPSELPADGIVVNQNQPRAPRGSSVDRTVGAVSSGASPPNDQTLEKEKQAIIESGIKTARRMNSTFACAEGVQLALRDAGQPEFLGSGDGWEMRYAFMDNPKWRVTNDPSKATAFVRSWSEDVVASYGDKYQRRNLGHVGLLYSKDDKLIELSDHEQEHLLNSPRYDKTIYFEYVG